MNIPRPQSCHRQVFLSAGAGYIPYNIPPGCGMINIIACAGGGGGGYGFAGAPAGGGGGGGYGATTVITMPTRLLPSTLMVCVGAGGTGGIASSTTAATQGGYTAVTDIDGPGSDTGSGPTAFVPIYLTGGHGGGAGTSSAGGTAGANGSVDVNVTCQGYAQASAPGTLVNFNSLSANVALVGGGTLGNTAASITPGTAGVTGGAGGGGCDGSGEAGIGGGILIYNNCLVPLNGGTSTVASGVNGGPGDNGMSDPHKFYSSGGAGGGASLYATGGAGGNGGYGSGGGGGGASGRSAGYYGGNGGNGGQGWVIIECW